jgi:hypothetical protein
VIQKKKNDFYEKYENGYENNGVMSGTEKNEKSNLEKILCVWYDFEQHDMLCINELKSYEIGHSEMMKKKKIKKNQEKKKKNDFGINGIEKL